MLATIPHRIAGIPCLIGIESYTSQAPAPRADSRDDFYGYTEYAIQILDRRGYRADWLARKITPAEQTAIENAIENAIETARRQT